MAGEKAGLNHSFPTRSGGTLPAPLVVMGRGGLCATSGPCCTREPSGEKGPGRDMSSGCNGALLASGPRGTSHFPDMMGAWVTMSSWWRTWAPESLPKEREARHQGPVEVLGQQELPVAAGRALPAFGVQLRGQSLPFNAASPQPDERAERH